MTHLTLHDLRRTDQMDREAEDRAEDAMRAQVYPDLWPAPSLGQTAPPPPPTQSEEEREKPMSRQMRVWLRDEKRRAEHLTPEAALRQRADEATRAENEAIAGLADYWHAVYGSEAHDIMRRFAAAIRARVAPKGEP